MITFTTGNLLEAKVEALVNTVNTVGVMGKGIALMFKERFEENFRQYSAACKAHQVQTGKMFVTRVNELDGPKWIINFPTKQHWRAPSQLKWIIDGLKDLKRFIVENNVRSIAIPPLGAGQGKLDWSAVREQIRLILSDIRDVQILVFEPIKEYQNVAKRTGVEKLTQPRALIAELVRRYWVLGMECSLLEVQKLAWFLEQGIERAGLEPLDLRFEANKFGPYADRLRHLLNGLDGSYLRCEKRIGDADPYDVIWFNDDRREFVQAYLGSVGKSYEQVLESISILIDGFESPFGMELLATVDWLLTKENVAPNVRALRDGLARWPAGEAAGRRKALIFADTDLEIALDRLLMAESLIPKPDESNSKTWAH